MIIRHFRLRQRLATRAQTEIWWKTLAQVVKQIK